MLKTNYIKLYAGGGDFMSLFGNFLGGNKSQQGELMNSQLSNNMPDLSSDPQMNMLTNPNGQGQSQSQMDNNITEQGSMPSASLNAASGSQGSGVGGMLGGIGKQGGGAMGGIVGGVGQIGSGIMAAQSLSGIKKTNAIADSAVNGIATGLSALGPWGMAAGAALKLINGVGGSLMNNNKTGKMAKAFTVNSDIQKSSAYTGTAIGAGDAKGDGDAYRQGGLFGKLFVNTGKLQNELATSTSNQKLTAGVLDTAKQAFTQQAGSTNMYAQQAINKNYNSNAFTSGAMTFGKQGMRLVPKGKSGIHIKKENEGKFTATKKATGETTEELTHSSNPLTRKRAVFAQNAKKWKHQDGGIVEYQNGGRLPNGGTNAVLNYQKMLNSQYGANIAEDGLWGDKTEGAFERFEPEKYKQVIAGKQPQDDGGNLHPLSNGKIPQNNALPIAATQKQPINSGITAVGLAIGDKPSVIPNRPKVNYTPLQPMARSTMAQSTTKVIPSSIKPNQNSESEDTTTLSDLFTMGKNWVGRQLDKRNTNLKESQSHIDIPTNSGRPIITGDTLRDNDRRYHIPEVIDLNQTKFGVRNRGDVNPISTEGAPITTFEPFRDSKSYFDNSKDPSTATYIALDKSGAIKVGSRKDFEGGDYQVTKTFSNKVIDFKRDTNGNYINVPSNPAASKSTLSPSVRVMGDDGKEIDGKLSLLLPKQGNNSAAYGAVTGGRYIMQTPDGQSKVVSGSLDDIAKEFYALKGKNPYVNVITLDNGAYSRGLRTFDKTLTSSDLHKYDLQNDGGGNFAYLKSSSGTQSSNKFDDFRAQALTNLQKLYPNRNVDIKYQDSGIYSKNGGRDIDSQANILKAGHSQTGVSLHNFDAARDYVIYVNGKAISPNNKALYQKTLWPAADKTGVYHLDDWDVGHIGLAKEGQGTAFDELKAKYPDVMESNNSKHTINFLNQHYQENPGYAKALGLLNGNGPILNVATGDPYTRYPYKNSFGELSSFAEGGSISQSGSNQTKTSEQMFKKLGKAAKQVNLKKIKHQFGGQVRNVMQQDHTATVKNPQPDKIIPAAEPAEPHLENENHGYTKWLASLPKRLQETGDYDLKGYFDKYGAQKVVGDSHLTDEFKKPNHVSFSNESVYNSPEKQGGEWRKARDGKWEFIASPWNIQNVGLDSLREYFKQNEPSARLILPVTQHKDGGPVNVIVDGALHSRKHALKEEIPELADANITLKGVPVVSEAEGGVVQHAEVERDELILHLQVTKQLESLLKEGTDEAAIQAGRILSKEIVKNTKDSSSKILKNG